MSTYVEGDKPRLILVVAVVILLCWFGVANLSLQLEVVSSSYGLEVTIRLCRLRVIVGWSHPRVWVCELVLGTLISGELVLDTLISAVDHLCISSRSPILMDSRYFDFSVDWY